jgi:hypothetical protein
MIDITNDHFAITYNRRREVNKTSFENHGTIESIHEIALVKGIKKQYDSLVEFFEEYNQFIFEIFI